MSSIEWCAECGRLIKDGEVHHHTLKTDEWCAECGRLIKDGELHHHAPKA